MPTCKQTWLCLWGSRVLLGSPLLQAEARIIIHVKIKCDGGQFNAGDAEEAEASQAYTALRAARKEVQKLKKAVEAESPASHGAAGRKDSGG